jgi:uncharacterized RDD family membrane protein YckC
MMPERYFWRRFFASGVDMLVLPLLLLCPVVIVSALVLGRMPSLGPSGCDYFIDKPTADRIERVVRPAPLERLRFIACPAPESLVEGGRLVTVTVISLGLTSTYPRIMTYHVYGANLDPAEPPARDYKPVLVLIATLPLLFALFDSQGRQTPGKKLTRLYLRRTDNKDAGFLQSALREYGKFLPLIVLAGFVVVLPQMEGLRQEMSDLLRLVESGDPRQVPAVLAGVFGGQLALMLVFLGPIFAWHGQTWYDRQSGTYVAKGRNSRAILPVRA